MFADWYRPGAVLDYPVGGSAALVEALVRGLQRYGGELSLNAHGEQVVVQTKRAGGVRVAGAGCRGWGAARFRPARAEPWHAGAGGLRRK